MNSKQIMLGKTITGVWIDDMANIHFDYSKFIVGNETTGGWYKITVDEEIFEWVQEYGTGLWTHDRSAEVKSFKKNLIIRPKLLTLLKLKWS